MTTLDINDLIGKTTQADCMDILPMLPDKCIDLALIDPPYGIGESGGSNHSRGTKKAPSTKFAIKGWDKEIPPKEFFSEIKRVSKNRIIWGGNYFVEYLENSSCWLVWDKLINGDFADCELAWTNFNTAVRMFTFAWNGFVQGDMKNKEKRIHPTQKPIALYKWCLSNYSKPGNLVLDPMSGSGVTACACHALGRKFICIERDEDYIRDSRKRFTQFKAQQDLFLQNDITVEPVQGSLEL